MAKLWTRASDMAGAPAVIAGQVSVVGAEYTEVNASATSACRSRLSRAGRSQPQGHRRAAEPRAGHGQRARAAAADVAVGGGPAPEGAAGERPRPLREGWAGADLPDRAGGAATGVGSTGARLAQCAKSSTRARLYPIQVVKRFRGSAASGISSPVATGRG